MGQGRTVNLHKQSLARSHPMGYQDSMMFQVFFVRNGTDILTLDFITFTLPHDSMDRDKRDGMKFKNFRTRSDFTDFN